MAEALSAVLKVLELAGYVCIAFIFSTFIAGVLLWAMGSLPLGDWTSDDLTLTFGTAMGYAAISLAMAGLAYPLACLIPKLRWLRAWMIAVVLANLVTIVAGVNAYMLQNP